MKKYISFILAAVIAACCLPVYGNSASGRTLGLFTAGASEGKQLQIVTTIFPEFDWVREVLGDNADNAEITMLLDNGVDLHNYQPTAGDILKISTCDLFIYVGGESDEWAEDALQGSSNEDRKEISLLEALGGSAKEEEVVEGMEAEKEEGEGDEEENPEYDEHVWLSLKNAQVLCDVIAGALMEIDSDNSSIYQENAKSYNEKLARLDTEYQTAVDSSAQKTILFGDRFPFRYLADDYGLSYYAAFTGCSAETEASFETIIFLAGKVDELGLHSVLTIDKSDQKIAQTIVENTRSKDQQILALDSMQSMTSEDVSEGLTYLSVMERNLSVLKDALK